MIRTKPRPLDDGLPFSKQRSRPVETVDTRVRSPRHLDFVRQHRCCSCGAYPVHAHHLTIGPEPKARGLRASDMWCVPLCPREHDPNSRDSVHFAGDERAWWAARGIDPLAIARTLAAASVKAGRLKPEDVKEAA